MVEFWKNAVECDYTEYNGTLTEQCTHEIGDKGMISGIWREVSALENIDDATGKRVLVWAQRVEAQRAQKETLKRQNRPGNLMLLDTVHKNMTIMPKESINK